MSGIIKDIEKTLLLDKVYDCSEVYKVFGTGAAITLFSSFFPGAGTVTSMSSRSAYYGVRTANAFTNLATRDVIPLPSFAMTYILKLVNVNSENDIFPNKCFFPLAKLLSKLIKG